MQRTSAKTRLWTVAALLALGWLLWLGRALVWLAVRQLFLGGLAALAALPLAKRLEKRFSGGAAAVMAIGAVNALLIAGIVLLAPSLIRQARLLAALLPGAWSGAEALAGRAQAWFARHGFALDGFSASALWERAQGILQTAAPAVLGRLGSMAGGMGQWLLAPVFGFYFVRDRRLIENGLLSLVPAGMREMSVRLLREMRREIAGYLRGQLMICLIVGALTAAGLLVCGTPAWLLLGALMGGLELIPYAGPALGAVLVALFTLPEGWWRTLWALGVVLAVQQAEGSVLSPRFISQTTRLHPAAVILCAVLGGAAAGVAGMLLCVPLVLCVRAALRVIAQANVEKSGFRYK